MEAEIDDLLEELTSSFNKREILLILYNPNHIEGEVQEKDLYALREILKKCKIRYPLLILYGRGGEFTPSVMLPRLLKKYVKKYKVYVPSFCSSCLCYTLLKADELILGPKTKITQIDPVFPHEGEQFRAIKQLKSKDPILKEKSRTVFYMAQKQIRELIRPPSLFKFKNLDYGEYEHTVLIVKNFMDKEKHSSEITTKELVESEANVKELSEEDRGVEICNKIIKRCNEFMLKENLRAMIISSIPFKVKGENGKVEGGKYLCPGFIIKYI